MKTRLTVQWNPILSLTPRIIETIADIQYYFGEEEKTLESLILDILGLGLNIKVEHWSAHESCMLIPEYCSHSA